MKKVLVMSVLAIMMSCTFAQTRFVDTKTELMPDTKAVAKELATYDVIMFGELHDIEALHKLQEELSQVLVDLFPNLALSFEMWERDMQPIVDQYLAENLSEAEFLKQSRAWTNYEDYLPLINLAKQRRLEVIAANIPREYATRVAREGWEFVDNLPEDERKLIARKLTAPDDDYRKEFVETIRMGGHEFSDKDLENYYRAQCIKDDTMAESIADFIKRSPGTKVIHYNGDFHSRNRLGTVSRLQILMPNLKIAVLSPHPTEDLENPILPLSMEHRADYLILFNAGTEEANR